MFNTIDYIRDLVGTLTFTQKIDFIHPTVNNETTIEVCKTYWSFPKGRITIDGQERIIKDVEPNESITIQGSLVGTETEYTIKAPNFYKGTPLQVSNALVMVKDWKKKLPMVYFIQPVTETIYPEPTSKIYNESKFKVLFLLPGDLATSIDYQYQNAITPANQLVFEFERKVLTDVNIGVITNYTKAERPNYGVWVRKENQPKKQNIDNIKRLIDEDVSGVELEIEIPFKRSVCSINDLCKKG
jgi:hypothetical protein